MSTNSTPPYLPNTNGPDAWRTEPEIEADRQNYLKECLAIVSDPQQESYPFKDVALSRADVEWLLATHRSGNRLDLQMSDLQKVNLSGLPLEGAKFRWANLEGADLSGAHLERADLSGVHLERADLLGTHLEGADLRGANLEGVEFIAVRLEGADLIRANLEGAKFIEVHLEGAKFSWANLEGADLSEAHLEGADLSEAHLEGADLSSAFFTSATDLRGIVLGNKQTGFASLAGVRWNEVDLSVVDWTQVNVLGDEQRARRRKGEDGTIKGATSRLEEYRTAVRANRQLAVALQGQGLNEEAARFAYRAQVLQRVVLRRQRKFGQYLFSLFIDLLAGYGYQLVGQLAMA